MKQKHTNERETTDIISSVISIYLFIMLGVFPLFYKYQYADMGNAKYKIFLYSSVICIVVFFLCLIFQKTVLLKPDTQLTGRKKTYKLSPLDTTVLIYFVCTSFSFLCSSFKEIGFWGSAGWNMGFLSQMLFISIYFLTAKCWKYQKWAVWLLMASSAITFFVAVLHRFDVDLLNVYGSLNMYNKILFLSTMGQSSWYSSFLCVVFPLGLYLFFISENKKVRLISGIYSVIAMCSLVTQNTDSAFMALFAVMMGLFYLSFENKMKRFFEVTILVLGSFCFIGICQRVFADYVIPLDTMSLFMSQSIAIWILFVTAIICYGIACYAVHKKSSGVLVKNKNQSGEGSEKRGVNRLVFWLLTGIIAVGIIAVITFIVLNTKGYLLEKYGYQSSNNYLLFDYMWGNGRGFAWKFVVTSFAEFPLLRKLIGVGPDCFSAYISSVPQYLEQMKNFWGDLVLTNAHNEYLTKLYNIGIIGLLSYMGMLVTAVRTFFRHRNENSILPAFALCVVSYMIHNIFCYEQVCCTPFFYILMGIGSNLIHNKIQKGTY